MNLRIVTKNPEADPEIGFLTKSSSKPYCRAEAMPTAKELTNKYNIQNLHTRSAFFRSYLFRKQLNP